MDDKLLELADPLARRVAMALDDVLTVDAVKLDDWDDYFGLWATVNAPCDVLIGYGGAVRKIEEGTVLYRGQVYDSDELEQLMAGATEVGAKALELQAKEQALSDALNNMLCRSKLGEVEAMFVDCHGVRNSI